MPSVTVLIRSGDTSTAYISEEALNLPHCHHVRIQREDLVVEARFRRPS
jgi:hypothetical protein